MGIVPQNVMIDSSRDDLNDSDFSRDSKTIAMEKNNQFNNIHSQHFNQVVRNQARNPATNSQQKDYFDTFGHGEIDFSEDPSVNVKKGHFEANHAYKGSGDQRMSHIKHHH